MRLFGLLLIVLSIGSFLSRLMAIEIPGIDQLPEPARYAGSLVGGLLFGFARARRHVAGEYGQSAPAGLQGAPLCANPKCAQPVNAYMRLCTACGTPIEIPALATTGCSNPACHAEITGDLPFCTTCGWPVADRDDAVAAKDTTPRCPNEDCREVVQPGQKFCTACGTSLN